MPHLTIEVPHALDQAEAVRRLKEQFRLAQETYQSHLSDLEEEWTDNTLRFSFRAVGMRIAGTLAVEASLVRIAVELPLAASLFKGLIQQQVCEELGKILA